MGESDVHCGCCDIRINVEDWVAHRETSQHRSNAKKVMQEWADKAKSAEEEFENLKKQYKHLMHSDDNDNAKKESE